MTTLNNNFEKLQILYRAINDINGIMSTDDAPKNHNTKLEAALAAIDDINKEEFNEDISNEIIKNIKKAVEDIYSKEMHKMNNAIGISLQLDHCEIVKTDNDSDYYFDDEKDDEEPVKKEKFDIKVNSNYQQDSAERNAPNISNLLNQARNIG